MGSVFPEMCSRVLLLNSSYVPMQVVGWQKALILWFQGKVEILEYHPFFARSMRSSFQVPSVLRLKVFVRHRGFGTVRFNRENVYIRDNFTCQYCGHKFQMKKLTLDHVIPVSKMGPKCWTNVVTACRDCNQKKAHHTPQHVGMRLLSEPKAPNWLPASELITDRSKIPDNWSPYLQMYNLYPSIVLEEEPALMYLNE